MVRVGGGASLFLRKGKESGRAGQGGEEGGVCEREVK